MLPGSKDTLSSWLNIYGTMLATASVAAVGGALSFIWVGIQWFSVLVLLVGLVLTIFAALRFAAVRRDISEGTVTERCYVQSYLSHRGGETLFVKTSHGSLTFGNTTSYPGKDLAHKWVVIEYSPASRLVLRVEVADDEVRYSSSLKERPTQRPRVNTLSGLHVGSTNMKLVIFGFITYACGFFFQHIRGKGPSFPAPPFLQAVCLSNNQRLMYHAAVFQIGGLMWVLWGLLSIPHILPGPVLAGGYWAILVGTIVGLAARMGEK